jgi:hypothetical protein
MNRVIGGRYSIGEGRHQQRCMQGGINPSHLVGRAINTDGYSYLQPCSDPPHLHVQDVVGEEIMGEQRGALLLGDICGNLREGWNVG